MNAAQTWFTPEQARHALQHGTGRGVKIAVLDSGIETAHPALRGLVLADDLAVVNDGLSLSIAPGKGVDVFGHGTAVAGIIRQLAPAAEIGSVRVLGERLDSRTAIIREGARQALERGYHVLNCAFGCAVPEHVLLYKNWVDEAYVKNIHVVAACNNCDWMKAEWPGSFTSVLTTNMMACGAQQLFYKGGHVVEFLARGVAVPVLWKEGRGKTVTGSSFAAAHLTGLLARLLSHAPGLTPLQAKTLLRHIAQPHLDQASC